jgi:hypothetical protein
MTNVSNRLGRSAAWLSLAAGSLLVGCAGSTTASARVGVMYGYDVVYVEPPPAYVYQYTPVYYRSYPAYWVDGRWYYRSPHGWVVFRQEPTVLRGYRVREYRGVYSAPPIRRYRVPADPGQGRYREAAPRPARERRAVPHQKPEQRRNHEH